MSVLPRIALFLQYVLPRNARNTQNLLTVYSPTDLHRTFLLYILPRNSRNTQNLLAVYSPTDCTDFHRFTGSVGGPTEFTEHTEFTELQTHNICENL